MITCWIPGPPDTHTQQQRKISWQHHRTYLPKAVRQNKQSLCTHLQASKHPSDGCPWDEPVELLVRYHFLRPHGKTHDEHYKDTKPDCDNMIKALCDAIEKAGIVKNDSRIARVCIEKVWCDGEAGTEIKVRKISERSPGSEDSFFVSGQVPQNPKNRKEMINHGRIQFTIDCKSKV